MTTFLEKAKVFWHEFAARLTVRRDTAPIDSFAALQEFAGSRSAYVAQKTLYGYVKARMGTRYPRMFEDETLMTSLNIAKMYVFAACLSDLTIYTVAVALHDQPVGNDTRIATAEQCYRGALEDNTGGALEPFSAQASIDAFKQRLGDTEWRTGAIQPDNFTASPKALFRWAPIADQIKKYDREIVENSVRFEWRDVRQDFQKRMDGAAICAELTAVDRERAET